MTLQSDGVQEMNVVDVKNVSFGYNEDKRGNVLQNISFVAYKGDFLCIIGSNGTGKSTLLKLMLNILTPTEGEITVLEQNTKSFRGFHQISYVSQKATSFNLNFPATVYEIVSLGLYAEHGLFKFHTKKDKQRILHALDIVGMKDHAKHMIGALSGGQQQRVFIAKALVSDPSIIFLDEPTVGIDTKAVDSICCLLGDLNKIHGKTIIMVTHDVSSILYHANKILTLHDDGSSEMTDAEIFQHQMTVPHPTCRGCSTCKVDKP